MGVIYIGDRAAGKTHSAMELANPNNNYVKVTEPSYSELKSILYDDSEGTTLKTSAERSIYDKYLEIEVELPVGIRQISLDWLDTPGEIWRNSWQAENQSEWQKFVRTISYSEGILLIVPPYREIIVSTKVDADNFITKEQWCRRFDRWVDFFSQECPKIRHILICLNKADLFCHPDKLKQEASKLAYEPYGSQMNWQQKNRYVSQKYFRPVQSKIDKLNRNIEGSSVRCFITSIYNRALLELPWIYLGSFLAK